MNLNYKNINWNFSLLWDKCINAHHYRIMGMGETFAYSSIMTTSNLREDFDMNKDKYIRFKVFAESENDNILDESNEINILNTNIENFEIAALYWYHWTTLTFRSKGVYDLYKIYSKNTLIAETEDPILEIPYKITKKDLGNIVVEWYTKIDENYVLGGVSDGIAKLPERINSDYKISIVIPVYNAAAFLPRTLDSILSSSMPDLGVILVNDGSNDESLDVCNWYAKNFPCVSVINQENQWVSAARNNWMATVKSEYIWFVDSDDIVHPFMYENLYNASKSENTDIAIATTIIRNNIREKEITLGMPEKKDRIIVYTFDEMMNNKHNKNNMYYVAVRNKIVKTEMAKIVQFPTERPTKVVLYEDCAYTAALYSYIDKFALSKDAYYIYDKRKQNTVWAYSAMYKNKSSDDIWKAFIYGYSFPIYNRCEKHKELSDYTNFKRLIESYDKFKTSSPLLDYRNEKLKELITTQKLDENNLIMSEGHLKDVINKVKHL